MRYYIAENGQPAGPFEANELLMHGLTVNSLVWGEGMPSWTSASQVPELMALLSGTPYTPTPPVNTGGIDVTMPQMPPVGGQTSPLPQVPPFGNQTQPTTTGTPYNQPNQPYAPPQYGPSNQQTNGVMPKTWLTEAIIATVACLLCCFNYVGIATGAYAIFKAMGVKTKFMKGDATGAAKDSSTAKTWVLITAAVCVVWSLIQGFRIMNDPSLWQQIQEGTVGSLYGF
ncbi:MAG: DUF4339 domain-containing protein [Muribaculaceae bacterium]|nr:DUF4339 domain-containing protein [Muribaculaceae bacterium]